VGGGGVTALSPELFDGATSDRVVLITGGTGSFGTTLTKKLLDHAVREVRIFSRDEAKQDAMRHDLADERARFYLGDVRDPSSVAQAMAGVDYVFHAAALKQVPSCEFFPLQAVKTNVEGSSNVIEEAHRAGVQAVVCLSTDKAVYPVNAMGMSKALMEKTAQAFARRNPGAFTRVCVVRYGNVIYSRGSVIPLFVRQILAGQPVTVTDPNMTRFMMTLDESVDLVAQAFAAGAAGDLFIRKAPAATLECLVEALASLFGVQTKMDVIGVRHGEKLHETLATAEELNRSDESDDYFRIPIDARSLDYSVYVEEGEQDVSGFNEYTSASTRRLDVDGLRRLLVSLPELRSALDQAGRPVTI
jgi:UDP-N-acetylglucosamine 4,6-dehydratase/5-epimerase